MNDTVDEHKITKDINIPPKNTGVNTATGGFDDCGGFGDVEFKAWRKKFKRWRG